MLELSLVRTLAGVLLLFGLLHPAATPQGPAPCSNTGTKQTADSKLIVTSKSTDCDGDEALDCGYEEFYWPKIFGYDVAGSMSGHCCKTFVAWSQKRVFLCDGQLCTTSGCGADQAFPHASPVPCTGTHQNPDCTR